LDSCRHRIRPPSLRAAKTRGSSRPASCESTCPCTWENTARAKVPTPSPKRVVRPRISRSCGVKPRACWVKSRSCGGKLRSCRGKL